MEINIKGSIVFGVLLIAVGLLFLVSAMIPGVSFGLTWPVLFYLVAAGFYLPVFIWPEARQGLAALFIPGSIFLAIGLIFTYTVLTRDWVAWAYAWLLIPAGVGLGLALAANLGNWGRTVLWVGLWLGAGAVGLFGLFATLFGGPVIKLIGALLVILLGLIFLLRAFRR